MHLLRSHSRFSSRLLQLLSALTAMTSAGAAVDAGTAPPSRVVIVRSKEADAFKQSEAAFAQALSSGVTVRSLPLEQATAAELTTDSADPGTTFLAIGTEAADRIKRTIPASSPLICAMVADPAGSGILEGRSTGVVSMEVPCSAQLDLIAKVLPNARSIGLLYNSDTPKGKRMHEALLSAIPKSWTVRAVAVNTKSSVSEAIDELLAGDPDVVWTYPDSALFDVATIKTLLLDCLRKKVPVLGFSSAFVRAGAIVGVGIVPADQGRQAASLVDARPGTDGTGDDTILPPEFKIYVNAVVAERLGITLPDAVVQSAATVFKGE